MRKHRGEGHDGGVGSRPWHLPGLERDPGAGAHEGRTRGGLPFRTPRLDRREAARVAGAVRGAALEARRARSTREVASALARAALPLADPERGAGREAVELLDAELGWTAELARRTLAGMADAWREDALLALLERELEGAAVVDGFVPDGLEPAPAIRSGRRKRRAVGPPLLHVVHAGNVPGVAVTAAVRGLLVRSGVLCKAPEDEPGLLALFARELARVDPLLGRSLATTWWPGGSAAPAADLWARRAATVVAYGGEAAIGSLRAGLPPGTSLVAYGPKLGVGAVLPDAAEGRPGPMRDAAAGLARDVCAYEQAGCVSPRVVYVVGPPDRFARRLADALEEETDRRPPPPPGPEEAVALRSLRARAEFRGYAGRVHDGGAGEPRAAGGGVRLLASGEDLTWTVLVGGDPAPASEGLPRVVRVHGVASVEALESALEPAAGRLQTMGYAGREGRDRLARAAVRLGICRLAPFGSVAWPPSDWRHDGRHQLLPLVRWTELEEPGTTEGGGRA